MQKTNTYLKKELTRNRTLAKRLYKHLDNVLTAVHKDHANRAKGHSNNVGLSKAYGRIYF